MVQLEMVKNYKRLNDYSETQIVPKYISYRKVYYTERELCEDRGFKFYDNVRKNKTVTLEITESNYLELKKQLAHNSSVGNVFKVSKTKENKIVSFANFIDNYKEENLLLPDKYMKKLIKIKEEIEQGRNLFIESNKEVFTEKAMSSVLNEIDSDIRLVIRYLEFFNDLKNNKNNKSYANKISRFKTAYRKLLKEEYKYNELYFVELVNNLIKSFNLEESIEVKKIINEENFNPKASDIKEYQMEMRLLLKNKNNYKEDYFDFLKKQLQFKYNLQEKDIK